MIDKVRQAVADVFGVPMSELTADSSPQTVEAWDSMGHLNLVLALEQSFGVQLSPEDIAGMTSVMLAAQTLAGKGAS
jgi:acyl carrier protein